MLTQTVEKLLVRQIEREAYSSNLYLAMASWAENAGLPGIADWFYAQSDEERLHLLKFIRYVNERDGKAVIPALEQPPTDYTNVLEAFKKVYEHEQFISASINEIVAATIAEKDFSTHNWLQWFVTEQIEEEASVKTIIDKLKLTGEHNLYQFDRDILSLRTKAAATQGA